MGQRRGRPRLAAQTLTLRRIGCQLGGQRLDRHRPVEARVLGAIHASHAATANLGVDAIRTDCLSRREWRRFLQELGQVANRMREELPRSGVVPHEGGDLATHHVVVAPIG